MRTQSDAAYYKGKGASNRTFKMQRRLGVGAEAGESTRHQLQTFFHTVGIPEGQEHDKSIRSETFSYPQIDDMPAIRLVERSPEGRHREQFGEPGFSQPGILLVQGVHVCWPIAPDYMLHAGPDP